MEDKTTRGGGGGPKRRCRYGAECRNKHSCKFYHPTDEYYDTKKSKQRNSKRDRSKVQCRYGMECRNMKCPFFHHPAASSVCTPVSPARVSPKNNDAAGVLLNGKIPPKSTPKLSEMIENGLNTSTVTSPVLSEQCSPQSYSSNGKVNTDAFHVRKANTKKKCRWGAGCRNKKCTFVHPGQLIDGDIVRSPKEKVASVDDSIQNLDSALMSNQVTSSEKKIHPILPPVTVMKEALDSFQSKSCSQSQHFSPTDSIRTPFQSHFNDMFTSVSDGPTSGFSEGETSKRTPLYSKSTSAYRHTPSLNDARKNNRVRENHDQFCQPTEEPAHENHPVAHQRNHPPDADWLFEVLGLNDITVNGAGTNMTMQPGMESLVEEPCNIICNGEVKTIPCDVKNGINDVTPHGQVQSLLPRKTPHICASSSIAKPKSTVNHVDDDANPPKKEVGKMKSKKLIPEDEIAQSRRAALELRLESQQKSQDCELLFTLLQTCRSKQEMIRTALEHSTDLSGETGTDSEIDESNIMALLELNELLVGAIRMAEASLHLKENGTKNGNDGAKGPVAAKAYRGKCTKVSKSKEEDTPRKPVTKVESSTAKPAPKGNNSTENNSKSKHSGTRLQKTSKQISVPKVENRKPEEKPHEASLKIESVTGSSAPNHHPSLAELAQQEKEKMARMLEEARKQSAAARERKKSKKNKKFDRWLKQNEEARVNRRKSWLVRIAKENDYNDLIQKLLVAEFLRQSRNKAMGLTSDRVLSDPNALELITEKCREAYHTIFGGLKSRVVVAGSDNKDMNGRQGTIRFWDKQKEKFCVGLDTKKSPDSDVQFMVPEVLDPLASSRPSKADKKLSATSYYIDAPDLMTYGGVTFGFSFVLQKSHIIALGSAESTKIGLEIFCKTRDTEEHQQKLEEEAEKKREEEDRKRRAARRAQENAAREQRKEQMRRDKEEYEQMKKEWAKGRREYGGSMFDYDFDGNDEEECQCPQCRFGGRFGNRFSSSGGAFFFNIGGIPFRVRFDSYDSDEDSFFDEFDERWEEQLAEEKEEENRKQAEILGVDLDADARTIKLAYRKKALQFHPDKWKSDSEHGMSRKEAENLFKSIQSAYDHLMSNFDE